MKETDLCEAFRSAAEADGWIVYPETSGWDLVLVWSGEAPIPRGAVPVPVGTQVGVEAKLRANVEVLAQVLNRTRWKGTPRPDHVAVLVPKAGSAFVEVAGALNVGVFTMKHAAPYKARPFDSFERDRKTIATPIPRRALTIHAPGSGKRLWLPPVVPTIAAGLPCPSALTPWRVKALRICHILRERGHVTSADFNALKINLQTWTAQGWIKHDGYAKNEKGSTVYRYTATGAQLPDVGFETESEAIAALS